MTRVRNPEGALTKRCTCTDPDSGKRLGSRCPKLRRPGGGWHPTHGMWGYQLELPARPTQARRQLRRSGFDNRDTASAELRHARTLLDLADGDQDLAVEVADLLHACRPGTPLPDRDTLAARIRAGVPAAVPTTTGDYLTTWLQGRRGLAEKTIRGYSDHIRLYLIPHLGKIPLQSLRTGHIEAMFTAIGNQQDAIRAARASTDPAVRATVKGVRPMEASSTQRLYATLRKALNDAVVRAKLIPANPALGVELPTAKRPKARVWTAKAVEHWQATGKRPSPVMVWTPTQAGRFLDHTQRHDIVLYAMYLLILHRGLRRGEACGLRDHDVDLDSRHLTIVEQITTVGYTPITRPVKSDAGDRTIPLGPKTTSALRDYIKMRRRWQTVNGDQWPDTGLFFVRPDGQPWHPQTISDRFDHLIATSGLPPVRLHDLRHCAASYLRHGGADMKEVQETLGHSTLGLTSDTYTSIILDLERGNADAAADLIPRNAA
ncbi:tyrosine-type recombinase/integrase [Micromonospora sp. HUAS LYJ1]|uniref:tyrosine-type recombinase/integrase n=1 Tax=Micromonospora sp. HUAS LYJ1 TaxID=3061626 RepID=UPI00267367AD|nr:tyrosine-type recombinase/integrase [Micromonospora sp. HUAS LYJ1]WKU03458.1 tyrosine-type recombinase/integrase [Micromonospora sp. HUAS LYJ1]